MEQDRTSDDQRAVGWAWTTGSPTGQALRARHERGDDPTPTAVEMTAIRDEWEGAGRPSAQPHVHRSTVQLVDGTTVVAVSFVGADPYRRDTEPAFGLYLDARWSPPWPHEHVDWPDFGLPADVAGLVNALAALLERARAGQLVEVGCLGGHGRTGTALACLAVIAGTPRGEAVDWVRTNYCPNAVETDAQRSFVGSFSATPGGARE